MKTSDYDYELPQKLIAQTPVEPRDASRLMVVPRNHGPVQHHLFSDLPDFLRAGDVLVFNDSRVIPARLYGRRTGTEGRVELLWYVREQSISHDYHRYGNLGARASEARRRPD